MKKTKLDLFLSLSRQKSVQILMFMVMLYILLVSFEVPFVFRSGFSELSQESYGGIGGGSLNIQKSFILDNEENLNENGPPIRPLDVPFRVSNESRPERSIKEFTVPLSSLKFDDGIVNFTQKDGFLGILKLAKEAYEVGGKLWEELKLRETGLAPVPIPKGNSLKKSLNDSCPDSIAMSGSQFLEKQRLVVLPCGLTLGSHITIVGKPKAAHPEHETKISLLKEGQYVMVSQFMMELQGLKTVEGEDPPRILHFNPRLKGDWSGKPVIEQNTCYRMQWGTAHRCEGWKSRADEETGDSFFFLF